MRLFTLLRSSDPSGVSGLGHVAEGCIFHDGSVAVRWCLELHSVGFYDSIADVEAIHGHHGMTKVEYIDSAHTAYEGGFKCAHGEDAPSNPYPSPHQQLPEEVIA